jgi:diguanylate cyclase (GGDEF)-like protein
VSSNEPRDQSRDEGEGERLRGTTHPDALPVELVSAYAGDRTLSADETARVAELKERRGKMFFSDLLYAISHHYFAPEIAEGIWNNILSNRYMMSTRLGRNVRITVATLDYLSNIRGELKSLTLMSETSVAQIVNLSLRDGMTGLFNHSTCFELLELELRNHRRYGVGVGLILLDIDDFKAVNDRWGHQEGDRILVELARTLKQETRDSDISCRYGGEEFAVILPFTADPREAFHIAERIRIGATRIASHGQPIAVSAGVALCDGPEQASLTLVGRADRALYQAKAGGKNRVIVSGAPQRLPDPSHQEEPDPKVIPGE